MRIRSIVTSAAMLGALMTSSALVSEAWAQKGSMMSPSTAWAVTKVDNAAGAYCAMARKFNQNTVLTIARNERSETSFAIDFKRPVFRSQGNVSVILDPGAGQQRAYEINPVSSNAFVVRLGRDASFFDAIARTGLLRVEMDGQSYHFNVSDIDQGEFKLDACVANMVLPAAGDEEPLMPAPDTGVAEAELDSSKSYRQEINNLRRQISSLQNKNEALKVQMETRGEGAQESSSSVAMLSSELEQLKDENAALKRELEAAQKPSVAPVGEASLSAAGSAELEELRQENLRLKAELQTVQPQENIVAELEREIDALKTKNASLQQAVDAQGQGEALVAELKAQISALEQQNASLNEQIVTAGQGITQDYEQEIAALSAENAELKANMDKKGVDAGLLDQLRTQIAKAENENRLLQETAAQAQQNLEQELRAEHVEALAKAQEDAQAQQADVVAGLKQELETLRAQTSGDADQAQRLAALQLELEALKAENARKGEQLVEVGEETAKLQELQEENQTLVEKLASVEIERAQAETMLKRIEALESENSELQVALESAASAPPAMPDADIEALRAENAELKLALEEAQAGESRIAALESQVAELNAANDELSAMADNSSVQAELDAALNTNEELRSQIESKDSQIAEMEALRGQLEALKAEQQDVAEADAEVQAENEELRSKIAELEGVRDEMKLALRDVVAVAEGYKEDNQEQAATLAALEQEIEGLKTELASAESVIEEQAEVEIVAAEAEAEAMPEEPTPEPAEDVSEAPSEPQTVAELIEKTVVDEAPREPKAPPAPAPRADVPTPAKKPAVPVTQLAEAKSDPAELAAVEAAIEADEGETVADSPSLQRLIALEQEMSATDPDDPKMQELAQEYMALKQRVERMDEIQQAAAAQAVKTVETVETPEGEVVEVAAMPEAVSSFDAAEAEPAVVPMNEAQRLEQSMKMMATPAEPEPEPEVIAFDEPVMDEPEEEAITMSASADPFAEMAVESEDGEMLQEATRKPVETVALSEPMEQTPAVQTSAQPTSGAYSSLQELITAASVSTPDKIKKVDSDKGNFDVAYQWNGGSVYGSAEQMSIASPAQFDDLVKDYLERTQNRCPGEFAIVPDETLDAGGVRADSYEVACVGSDVSSGASLLFFNQGGTFTVVAHEAPATELDTAMTYRNQVKRVVTGI